MAGGPPRLGVDHPGTPWGAVPPLGRRDYPVVGLGSYGWDPMSVTLWLGAYGWDPMAGTLWLGPYG